MQYTFSCFTGVILKFSLLNHVMIAFEHFHPVDLSAASQDFRGNSRFDSECECQMLEISCQSPRNGGVVSSFNVSVATH